MTEGEGLPPLCYRPVCVSAVGDDVWKRQREKEEEPPGELCRLFFTGANETRQNPKGPGRGVLGEEKEDKKERGRVRLGPLVAKCCRRSDVRIHKQTKKKSQNLFLRGVILCPSMSSKDIKGSRRTPKTRTIELN